MKSLFCIPLIFFSLFAYSQRLHTLNNQIYPTTGGSGVGIGKADPAARLHIHEETDQGTALKIDVISGVSYGVGENFPAYALVVMNDYVGSMGQTGPRDVFKIDLNGNTDIDGKLNVGPSFVAPERIATSSLGVYNSSTNGIKFRYASGNQPEFIWTTSVNRNFRFRNGNNNTTPISLSPTGKVGINTEDFQGDHDLYVDGSVYIKGDSPEDHSMYIEGSVITEEIFVKLKADWADYVFTSDYKLSSLEEVEKYIAEHGHLPGMPTASQVAEAGIALGETERILTEKVEELTLHLIEMNKEIKALREEITTLKVEE